VAEALVRPVRSSGEAVTAAGRELEKAAGPTLTRRLEGLGELPVGSAVVTPGGALAAGLVIHAVVQAPEEAVSVPGVERALVNAFRRVRDWGLASVALTPLGTGAGNLEPESAARLLSDVLREAGADGELDVTVVVDDGYEEETFRRVLGLEVEPPEAGSP
jgi:O-acetyl-ADP-ribose deacetylase (regulator of RNase III)